MIYLNHAATSFPKFPEVPKAVYDALTNGYTFGKRDSVESIEAARTINNLRDKISEILGAHEPHSICFTPSDSIALNHIIHSFSGGIVLTSSMEHNSVARPLHQYVDGYLAMDSADEIEYSIGIAKKIHKPVVGAVFSHASNVTGDVFDVEKAGFILHKHGIPFALDVAQTAGFIPIEADKWHVSAMAFAGHKGLGGPQGTGGLYVRNGFNIKPVVFGGTGNASMDVEPPTVLPDSVEVGTQPAHDLFGLSAAIKKIDEIGWEEYSKRPVAFAQKIHDALSSMDGITVYGSPVKQIPVVSFTVAGKTCKEVGAFLASKDIVCRTGVHCSAWAISRLGLEDGTVRVSCGYTNTKEEIETFIKAINEYVEGN